MPATQRQWIRKLEAEGWTLERGGKHQAKMTKPGCRPITLPEQDLHVKIRQEDGSYWATIHEYPGVLATGDDLEELRASLEEGIRLMKAEAGQNLPAVRLSELTLATETPASAELLPA